MRKLALSYLSVKKIKYNYLILIFLLSLLINICCSAKYNKICYYDYLKSASLITNINNYKGHGYLKSYFKNDKIKVIEYYDRKGDLCSCDIFNYNDDKIISMKEIDISKQITNIILYNDYIETNEYNKIEYVVLDRENSKFIKYDDITALSNYIGEYDKEYYFNGNIIQDNVYSKNLYVHMPSYDEMYRISITRYKYNNKNLITGKYCYSIGKKLLRSRFVFKYDDNNDLIRVTQYDKNGKIELNKSVFIYGRKKIIDFVKSQY